MTRIIDLTHALTPGKEERTLELKTFFVEEILPHIKRGKDVWYIMQELKMLTHIGTHIESPYHYIKDGIDASQIPLENLVREGVVLDFSHKKPFEKIDVEDFSKYEQKVRKGDIVLIRTDRSKYYGTSEYHQRPYLTPEAVKWLIKKKISCLGVDASGIEVKGIHDQPNHKLLFENGIPLIENLTNLDQIRKERVLIIVLPLKIKGMDASPLRVIAIEED
jgi:kynurenine formamidase